MKDRLTEYREAMDRSVFKDQQFTGKQKQDIFKKINEPPQRKEKAEWIPRSLSVAFLAILLLIGGYLLKAQIEDKVPHTTESTVEQPLPEASNPEVAAGDDSQKEEETLESPYREIKTYFEDYELPQEGRLPKSDAINGISYENGYTFDRDTKAMVSRVWNNGEVNEPSEGQKIGVIMGWLNDASGIPDLESMTITNDPNQFQQPISRLEQVKEATEFEPLKKWTSETIEVLASAQKTEDMDARQELIEEGYTRLQKMTSLITEEDK